jgi:Ketosteroid isomerase homolog
MKRVRNVSMLIALAAFLVSPSIRADDFKTTVQSAASKWDEAFNKGDAAQLAKMYGSQAALLPPGGAPVVGEQNIQQFWKTTLGKGFGQHKVMVQQAETKGDIGYAYGRWQATGPGEGGANKQYEGNWSNVLERQGGQWKTVLHAWN